MNLLDILKQLNTHNIQLGLENDQLKVTAAKGAMTPALLQLLKDNKETLLNWARSKQQHNNLPAITPAAHSGKLPLSFNQQGLWFIYKLAPEAASYNMPMALRLRGTVNISALEQAMNALQQRHNILRTQLFEEGEHVWQRTADIQSWQASIEPVTDENLLPELINREALQPFRLEQETLFRTRLWSLNAEDHIFMVTLHHIIADAASIENLLGDLSALYYSATSNTAIPLPPLHIQYGDYAIWQHRLLQEGLLNEQLAYWQKQLAHTPDLLHLPTDRPRPAVQGNRGAVLHKELPASTVKRVREFALANQYTPFMVFLAAQQLLLGRYAKQDDVCIAVPIAGRHQHGTEKLVGMFINTLVMRNRFGHNPSVADYLASTREMVLAAFSHQDIPLDMIIDKVQIKRSSAHNPIAQNGFNYLLHNAAGEHNKKMMLGNLAVEVISQTQIEAKYDMIWGLLDSSTAENYSLAVSIEYNTDLFDAETIEQYITHYGQLLENMLNQPETPVLKISLIDENQLPEELDMVGDFEQLLPLTPMQRDLYLDTLIDPDNRRNYFGSIQRTGQLLDEALFRETITRLAAHHAALRMRIIPCTKPYLDIAYAAIASQETAQDTLPVKMLDWSKLNLNEADFDEQAKLLCYGHYDLQTQSLIRFFLIKDSASSHAVVVTAHHACVDAFALQVLCENLITVYTALADNNNIHLPPDDFSSYARQQYLQCDNSNSVSYWQQQAQGISALGSALGNKQATSNTNYKHYSIRDKADHLANIQRYCQQHNTSIPVYLKAVYALLLQTYCTADDDFYFTDILAARPKGHRQQIGCYFEQRPQIIRKANTFTEMLAGMDQWRVDMGNDKRISNGLQQHLLPVANAQFYFNFYITDRFFPFMGVTSNFRIIAPQMNDAVNLIVLLDGSSLRFNFSYSENIFEDHRFIERFLHVSQQLIDGTDKLAALNLQLPSEQTLLSVAQEVQYTHDCVSDMIATQVFATPDAIAVKDRQHSLSYRELNTQANQLAQYLVNVMRVQKGDSVALCLDANCNFMVALLATLKCGACYIPVDPQYPLERIRHILNDAHARCIIAAQCSAEHIKDIDSQKLFIDSEQQDIAEQEALSPNTFISLDDALYTIYTSGSTGLPKGATVKQRGEINLLQWYNSEFNITATDKVLILSATGFDLTQKNLLGPLCTGACIVFPEMAVYDPRIAIDTIAAEHITLINCAPSAFYPCAENATDFSKLASLRLVLFGGEPIRMNALLPWLENPACAAQVVNMYGPTECTDISSFYRIEQPHQFVQQPVPIGHANANVSLFVADSHLRLLPQGLVGELLVGGEGVGLGYRQLPAMTAEKFIRHPQAGLVYRTGDLVKQRDDGEYVFIGRIDHQVKLRGLRIELGEIEFALRQIPGVKDSLAMVHEEKLTGYILNDNGKAPDNWRSILGTYLPDYMLPQGIAALTEWPLSANGKIDRKALPAMHGTRRTALVAPRNNTETRLAAIWREVLGVDDIGIHDSFFELGGHSLLVVRAVARIRDEFQQDIPLRDVFFTPTIAAIAELLDKGSVISLPAIHPLNRDADNGRYPLSFAQQRLWFIEQMTPGSSIYNMPFALNITGKIDMAALQKAFADTVQRHEALRTRFINDRGTAFQVVDDAGNASLLIQTMAGDEQALLQHAAAFLAMPFDLANGPLFRAELLQHPTEDRAILLLCLHHIIADGWSIELLIRDMLAFYQACQNNSAATLPALPVQYVDYSAWQRHWLSGDVLQQQVNYWQQQLQGAETLELPTDFVRPALISNEGSHVSFSIPPALTNTINQYCQQQGITLYMFLLGSFQLLLGKYSKQNDISVGSPIANRPLSELQNMVGLFVNTLVLRSKIDPAQHVNAFMQAVKNTCLEAYQHQDIPFELVVDELHLTRELSQTPLFQAMLVVQNLQQQQLVGNTAVAGLQVSALENNSGMATAKFDLTLNVVDDGNTLHCSLEYRSKLFTETTMASFCRHFSTLLESLVTSPDSPIATLNYLSDDEKQQQLLQWNNTAEPCDYTQDIMALFNRQATATPDAVAVRSGTTVLTYSQFSQRVSQLAQYLVNQQQLPERAHIVICQRANADFLVSVFAAIKAGACYIPVDPAYPGERIRYIIDNTAADLVLCDRENLHHFEAMKHTKLLVVDAVDFSSADDVSAFTSRPLTPDTPLYMIFTSGSTGLPKGVEIVHRGETNLIQWYLREFGFGAGDKFLIISATAFDLTQKNFFAPLCCGGEVVFHNQDFYDPQHIKHLINELGITVINCAPSALYPLIENAVDYVALATLRTVLLGGEAIRQDIVGAWLAATGYRCELVNMYGPTECTDISTTYIIRSEADLARTAIPIGKPIANTQAYILDNNLQLLPAGLTGELYIGGAGVSNGYVYNRELNASTFINSPFNSADIIYKTGDLARYLADGSIEYIGRIDHQVKIRGFRIELNEIENRLAAISGIHHVVVLAIGDTDAQQLVCYFTREADAATELTPALIRTTLASTLPEYMIPAAFVELEKMPLSNNGKIDRNALSKLPVTFTNTTDYVAPRNDNEQQLAIIWQEILGREQIGIHDNFFENGGHSLLAVKLVARIRDTFQRELSLHELFTTPTIAGIATILIDKTSRPTLPAITAQARDSYHNRFPLSFAQQRLWFIDQLDPNSAIYNIPFALRISGTLDIAALQQAFANLVERHESLRTAFVNDNGMAYQTLVDTIDSILAIDTIADDKDAIYQSAVAFFTAPFHLDTAPLLRAKVLALSGNSGDNDHVFLFCMHHIISDGLSMEILVRDLFAFYQACRLHIPTSLPPLPVQYIDYSLWQREWLTGDVLQQQIDYWRTQLAGTETLALPLDFPRSKQQDGAGAQFRFSLQQNLRNRFTDLCQQQGVTLYMGLVAILNVALHKYCMQNDIVIGTPVANRQQSALENLIGFFLNTLVLRNHIDSNADFNNLLDQVKQSTLQAFAHQDVPFELLVEKLDIPRQLEITPLFQVMLVLQNTRQVEQLEHTALGDMRISAIEPENTHISAKFDLTFNLVDGNNSLEGLIEYRTALFKPETIERMAHHFTGLLEQVCAQPQLPIAQLQLLSADEQHELLWHNMPVTQEYSLKTAPAMLARFEQHALQQPDAIAVTFNGKQISYGELDTRANQLANYLRSTFTLAAGDFIGICLERSPLQIISLLAIFKLECAYIPLDPASPAERLHFIMDDSGIGIVLAETASADKLASFNGNVCLLDNTEWHTADNLYPPAAPLASQHTAYIIYTSGTTGKPKGCEVSHYNLSRLFVSTDKHFSFGADDVWTFFHSFAFDFSVWEIWGALAYGGKVVIVDHFTARSTAEFYQLLAKEKVTVLNQTPSAFSQLIAIDNEQAHSGAEPLSALRYIVFGGEALDFSALQLWKSRYGLNQPELVNMYGITETTVHVTYHRISENDFTTNGSIIGEALPDLKTYILSPELQWCPQGIKGELYVSGPGVSLGYLGRVELTQQRFIANPFVAELPADIQPLHQRLYRTGDLAKLNPAFKLEYLGRIDHQVKIRGHRIELGEIEAAIAANPSVRECIVQVDNDAVLGQRLVAYILVNNAVVNDAEHFDAQALKAFIREELPEYMVPQAFVALTAWPLTANGKVNTAALPKPEHSSSTDYVAPRTEIETLLAAIWAEVLGLEQVGIHDNFFELGGHSLLATRLVARIRNSFGHDISLRELFNTPTIASIAETLENAVAQSSLPAITVSDRTPFNNLYPLSFAQQRLWFIEQLAPGTALYHIPFALRVSGIIDTAALQQAFTLLLERHESLRTAFSKVDGEARQSVLPATDAALQIMAFNGNIEQQQQHIADFFLKPFDLQQPPLLRAELLTQNDKQHLFLLCLHHIIADGWSMEILVRDLLGLYQSLHYHLPPALEPLPLQYIDYALWQREWLAGDVLQQQLDYWRTQLAATETLALPLDYARGKTQDISGAEYAFRIPATLHTSLQQLCQQTGSTFFMGITAALNILLHKYAQQNDIAIGTPVAGRQHAELEPLIGFFINTLVLRNSIDSADDFVQFLGKVKHTTLQAFEHQDVPFELLVEKLDIPHQLEITPLFQVMLVLQNAKQIQHQGTTTLGDITLSTLDYEQSNTTSKFDLVINLLETNEALDVTIGYRTALFKPETIARMAQHFIGLLQQACAKPQLPIAQLQLLSTEEQHELLWHNMPLTQEYGLKAAPAMLARFEQHAAQQPGHIAVTFNGEQISYGELNAQANQLANYLRSTFTLAAGDFIGICLERSPLQIISLLAIFKLECAYIPLDPASPAERLHFIMEDSGIGIVLAETASADKLASFNGNVCLLDNTEWQSADNLYPSAAPLASQQTAYIIYTSGTTGKPKGCEVSQHNLSRLFVSTDKHFSFGADDVWTFFHSFAFDFSVWEIWGALAYGGKVVIVDHFTARSTAEFYQLLAKEKVTVLNQTPSAFSQLIAIDNEQAHSSAEPLSALRYIVFGGETLDFSALQLWKARYGLNQPELVNMYGITETTVHVTYHRISESDFAANGSIIGEALPDLKTYILSPELQWCPQGIKGELYVSGPGVSLGYLGRKELTQQRFIANPFLAELPADIQPLHQRLYRTGDLAKLNTAFKLEYLGRIDHQVKIRGHRIELGEIEAAIAANPSVRECIVQVDNDAVLGQRLVAYILVNDVDGFDAQTLKMFIREELPEYMVPQAFVALTAWPLTANGKVNTAALPKPEHSSSTDYVAPRTDTETLLAAIWADVLGLEQVGIHDNFFELGGHSLLAVRLLTRVHDQFHKDIPLRELFFTPTIAALAEWLDVTSQQGLQAVLPPIEIFDRNTANNRAPLSFAQQRLWFIDQLEPGSAVYNMPFALKLHGTLDIPALQTAFNDLLQRHEALRTRIITENGLAWQAVTDASDYPLGLHTINGNDETILAYALQFLLKPFDLANDSLIRAEILHTGSNDYILLLCLHHIISDGWSMEILVRDLLALYHAHHHHEQAVLPPLPVQYIDYSVWQKNWLSGDTLQQQVDYWRTQLANSTTLELPVDFPRPAVLSSEGKQLSFVIPAEINTAIRQQCQQQGITLFMFMLGSWQLLLGKYSNQTDISIGTPIANRPLGELENMIGLFINTLVMRSQIDNDLSMAAFLQQVKLTCLNAYQHQDIPFELLVDELHVSRELSQTPLFQSMLVLQSTNNQTLPKTVDLGDMQAEPLTAAQHHTTAKFDLTLHVVDSSDQLHCTLEYRSQLFSDHTMQQMSTHFTRLLELLCSNMQAPLKTLALLDAEQQRVALNQHLEWATLDSALNTSLDSAMPFYRVFEQQAAMHPENIAFTCGPVQFSYSELNNKANQLAHHLLDSGIAAQSIIAICFERSAEMMIALLGVLKAGMAYVPVDPEFPAERIAFILQDSGSAMILTQAHLQALFNGEKTPVLALDKDTGIFTDAASNNIANTAALHDLAYVLYTSGSTGNPKGVMIEHLGLFNYLSFAAQHYMADSNMTSSVVSSTLTFDATITTLFAPLLLGKTVIFTSPHDKDFSELGQLIFQAGQVRLFKITPAHIELLASQNRTGTTLHKHVFVIGGEQLLNYQLKPWLEKLAPNAVYINEYGPTETVVGCCILEVSNEHNHYAARAAVPIGHAIMNTELYVLDACGHAVPQGATGELYIASPGVARGYLNRDDLNSSSFIANAFNAANARLYKTGDLVRYLPDGELEYIGRSDDQVKIRGFRIELNEIENRLTQITQLREAVVLAKKDEQSNHYLIAYYTLANGDDGSINSKTLAALLRQHLPEYMIPSAFVVLPELPLTHNGKIDRKALLQMEVAFTASTDYKAPGNATELALCQLWQELLGRERIGVNDNFFELGGHSLLAIRLVADIAQKLQCQLSLRSLFEAPTIAQLAEIIASGSSTAALPPVTVVDRQQVLPLSFNQQRLWFLAQMDAASAAYNMPSGFIISGPLDIAALQQALQQIIQRQEILRTNFVSINGEPALQIHDSVDFVLQQLHASEETLPDIFRNMIAQPFNIATDLLLRATLVTLADERHALLLNMHHIIADAWSVQILVKELASMYLGYHHQLPNTLSELPVQYADYASWQRQWLQGETLAQEIAYWRNTLQGVPLLLNMPLDNPRPPVQGNRGAVYSMELDSTLSQRLRDFSVQNNVTVFMSCLAAYQVLLHKYSHQDDICTGIPLAGRTVPGIQNLIGFFINALAIRTRFTANYSLREILAMVKETTLSAFAHDQVPVEMLINELGIERNLSYTPVIQCAFNMMSADDNSVLPPMQGLSADIQIEMMPAEQVTAKFELLLGMLDTGKAMQLNVEYNTDIYHAATIEKLTGHYLDILQLMLANADSRLYSLQLDTPVLPAGYSKVLPLTTMQRDIYLASLAKPDTLENSLGFAFNMPFAVDVELWQNLLLEITAQNAILRADLITSKIPYHDIAYFAVSDSNTLDFELLDWSNDNLGEADIQTRIDQLVAKPYDLEDSARVSHRLIKINTNRYFATMAAHHMVLDGFAAVIIGTYLTTLYEKRVGGDLSAFSMEDHFADYISENRQTFDLPETINYWQQQMANVSGLQASAGTGHETRLLSLPIPAAHYKALRSYSKQFKITPPLYFKCLYAIMIRQYTRAENNFVVTEFQAGRNKTNKDSLGCFYHTNPTIVDINSVNGSIAELFETAREQQKAIRDYLQISHLKQLQMMPPSSVYFSYNYLMMPHFTTMMGEVLHGTRYTPNAEGAVDLRVQAYGDELCFWLAYNTRLFDDRRLLERMLHVSEQLVSGTIDNIADIDFTLPDEIKTMTTPSTAKLELLPLQISLQALATRDNTAVVCGNKQLSYAELEAQANVVAQQLMERGISKGDRVGICIGRRVELLPAILGAVKAGACYIPMDVNYPAERLAYMLEDSAAAVLITEQCMLEKLPATNAFIMDIDAIDLQAKAPIPRVSIGMDDLLYMIYTSGSTGQPKGATVHHRGESNLLAWYTREFGFTAQDRTLVMSAIGFDLTQKNLFALLTVGGTIVLPAIEHYDVKELLQCIEEQRITTLNCAPSAFYPLVENGGKQAITQLRTLRTVLFGGEPIHLKRLAPWIAADNFACSIVNMYGPTECTDISTFHTLSAPELTGLVDRALSDDYEFPLGKPNAGVSLYVLNDHNQPVPNGLAGELCIAGISVGGGYWNKPELTAQAFIPNPFSTGAHDAVLYRTGDLVRMHVANGEPVLYYIGRKDFQVKLRGLRIELGEIEHALRTLPAVHDTVVLVDNEQLLAFVLTDKHHTITGIDSWREALLASLPDYMVPKILVPVTAWPLTPNGKVDRNALLQLERPDGSTQYVAPRTKLEKDIAQLWQEVLGIGKAGVFDNFFEAGGDSLAAVRLVAGLEIRFNTKLPVSSLFGAQTISQLAHVINNQLAHWSPIVPIQAQGTKTPIFAVHALGAMVLSYEPLARALGKDQPFYGIQAYGFEEDQTPYTDLDEMLEFYIAAIRQQQPHGPYQLIGHSFGGILAVELAHKLESLGETVKFVGLLDSYMPVRYADAAIDDAVILKTFAEHNFGVVDVPLRTMRLMKPETMIKTVAERFHGAVTEEFIRSAIAIIRGFQHMMIGCTVSTIKAPIVLFKPQETPGKTRSLMITIGLARNTQTRGWHKISQQLEIIDVPGDHHSMLKVNEFDLLVSSIRQLVNEQRGLSSLE